MNAPHTVVFAGAGSSASFNVPIMREMTRQLGDRKSTPEFPDHLRPTLKSTADRLREVYGERYDLEKLLDTVADLRAGRTVTQDADGYPHLAFRLHHLLEQTGPNRNVVLASHDNQFTGGGLYGDLEKAIADQVIRWCKSLDAEAVATAWFDFLVALGRQKFAGDWGMSSIAERFSTQRGTDIQRVTFVTTNYDLGIETALRRAGVVPHTGFEHDPVADHAKFNLESDPLFEDNGLPLLKLHGSIDWWRDDRGRVLKVQNGSPNQVLDDGSHLLHPEIRYPVVTKDLGGLPYSALYTDFARALVAAKDWIFIGYSFGDSSITQLVREVSTAGKRILLIGPHASDLQARKVLDDTHASIHSEDVGFGTAGFGRLNGFAPSPSRV